ncbi:MAG: hypothetical protein ACLQPH_06135 [Acidimicrobiales bacterium]
MSGGHQRRRPRPDGGCLRRVRIAAWVGIAASLSVLAFVPGIQPGASAATSYAGAAGTDTAQPATDSQVTVSGRGADSGLQVTVNQTQDLGNQAISVTWKGGTPTFSNPSTDQFTTTYNGAYLQIFECWGDPQTANPPDAGPGPLPTQCEFGGESSSPTSSYPIPEVGQEYSRVLAEPSWSTYAGLQNSQIPGTSLDTWTDGGRNGTGYVVEPFQSVDGTVVDQQADYGYLANPYSPEPFWKNPYYSFATTNEVDFARTYPDGTGRQLFQVDTGLEASGLGCGQDIQPVPGGGTKTPQCWLVVVPRSTPAQENPSGLTGVQSVVTSPLTPEAWANRIAIPLGFNPVGSSCSGGAGAEQVLGSELASSAFASWEPGLCDVGSPTPYQYVQDNDDLARQNLTNPTYGSAGMSVFSKPVPASDTTPTDPIVYAPLTLSGVVVVFNIDRSPALGSNGQLLPDEVALAGSRVQNIYLTPRLVAKLLTESYQAQLENVTSDTSPAYGWVQKNPTSLFTDPDFLQYNPEFTELTTQQKIDAGTLIVEESSSDAASAVWNWILSDKSARLWLSGAPDPWGMVVNPYYSSNTDLNPSGVSFTSPTPETFAKSDPYCFSSPSAEVYGPPPAPARPLCVQDWSPYTLNMQAAALDAATANDGAKTTLDPTQTPNTAWTSNGPQESGTDFVMSITDSASAARYGLQTASLSRAGDDGSSPAFVAPTSASILAGEQAMTESATAGVLQANPSPSAHDAYPLSLLTYAATTPETLDATGRQAYADLIRYAGGVGQVSGDLPGQLPAGYVPLPAELEAEDTAAAASVLNPPAEPSATNPTTTSPAVPTFASGPSLVDEAVPFRPGTTVATTPATTPTEPAKPLGRSALATIRTHGIPIGVLRWMLPIILLVGLAAGIASLLIGRTGRPGAAAHGPPDGEQTPVGP